VTGFIPAQSVGNVGGEQFLKSLDGKPITVTGKIKLYKGRPEIVISSPAQIVRE
jgi:DNA/RNA endonuclease YhcR with UshA esterase domain